MSQNWYVMAFGVELGPMPWDELLERARRGDLRPDSQIRQGDIGPFIHAGDVPGLLGPAGEERSESAWFCEVLGAELGPMSWKELCLLAERGTLRGDARVRRGEGAWLPASSLTGLVQWPAAAANHSDTPILAPQPSTKAVISPAPPLGERDRAEAAVAKKLEPVAASMTVPATTAPAAPRPARKSATDRPATHPASGAAVPSARPAKAAKPAARRDSSRPRVPLQIPGKSLAVLAGVLLIASAGYFGWTWLNSRPLRPDYQQVAALYRQAYEQIKQLRSNPQRQSPDGLKFQFSRRIAALRTQLQNLPRDTSAGRLAEAGSQLAQMLADCQAASDSAEASRFTDSEQRFLAILDSFQDQRQK